ncbi:MAG: hypothetical protein ACFCGT_05850 [Sandaracinaceae bacterium]
MLRRVHYSAMGNRRDRPLAPDLARLRGVVADEVLDAMRAAAARLATLGVRHWVVGGLAVGAHGYPRGTKDVDFLVGDEAFERHDGGLVTMKPGLPIQAGGVLVDHLSAKDGEEFLTADLPAAGVALEVAPLPVLLYLKLRSARLKDRADVVELIKAGAELGKTRHWLGEHAPELVAELERAAEIAAREEE